MTNPVQPLDPIGANDPVTPADTPSSPSGYASVTPHGRGPAPYDVQAPVPDVTGQFNVANAVAGAGVLYPQGPRQAQTETLLSSPAGFALDGFAIDAGSADGWPDDVGPPEGRRPGT